MNVNVNDFFLAYIYQFTSLFKHISVNLLIFDENETKPLCHYVKFT